MARPFVKEVDQMSKSKFFLLTGVGMLIAAILFVCYAFNHPEASFPWDLNITFMIYIAYVVVLALMFLFAFLFRRKK